MADVRVIAINPPIGVRESERVGLVHVGNTIPLAAASAQGIALDEWFPSAIVASALKIVAPLRRLVGPASFAHPTDVTVLAHDDHYWVAEKPGQTIPLQRAPRK
jgi:hypothetical protein